ncbi:hypothetical protein GCM10009853_014440 [Glycomyces scopariae]|uniref:Uncharacterized protein n=1 Tax=Glycomyces sambucus TaxID=380244 RepID=A0A1G9IFM0_9ACTN|nr:hypothetical protein [Glycomyces sambucus]SDL23977.1 hypothetical protein SAMN05216298_3219 [Glycomyces sambucus]
MSAPANLRLPTRRYALGAGFALEGLKYFRYWLIAAVILSVALPLFIAQFNDIRLSAWFYAANVGKWFTAFVGGGFVYSLVPNMIAAGLTRRELAVSMGVFGLLWSALLGAIAFAGLVAERYLYGALDWSHGIDAHDVIAPIGSLGDTVALGASYPLLYLVYFAAGTVIGAASYRWEASGWLLLVPIVPIVFSLDNGLFDTEPVGPGWAGFLGLFMDGWDRRLIVAAIVLATAGLAAAAYRLLIDVPLRSKQA